MSSPTRASICRADLSNIDTLSGTASIARLGWWRPGAAEKIHAKGRGWAARDARRARRRGAAATVAGNARRKARGWAHVRRRAARRFAASPQEPALYPRVRCQRGVSRLGWSVGKKPSPARVFASSRRRRRARSLTGALPLPSTAPLRPRPQMRLRGGRTSPSRDAPMPISICSASAPSSASLRWQPIATKAPSRHIVADGRHDASVDGPTASGTLETPVLGGRIPQPSFETTPQRHDARQAAGTS